MAWERRERGGLYYTRSRRVGGRVLREYLGCGEGAQILAAFDEERRDERARARALHDRERSQALAVEASVADLGTAMETLVSEALDARGYHRHRGEWRKRRVT